MCLSFPIKNTDLWSPGSAGWLTPGLGGGLRMHSADLSSPWKPRRGCGCIYLQEAPEPGAGGSPRRGRIQPAAGQRRQRSLTQAHSSSGSLPQGFSSRASVNSVLLWVGRRAGRSLCLCAGFCASAGMVRPRGSSAVIFQETRMCRSAGFCFVENQAEGGMCLQGQTLRKCRTVQCHHRGVDFRDRL